MKKLFQRSLSLVLALLTVVALLPVIGAEAQALSNNPLELLKGVFLTSAKTCTHQYTGRGKCSVCGQTFDFLATRKETSALLQPVTGTIWVMDTPYSAGSGGRNLLDANGNKIATKEAMHISATVQNAYGNTWCQLILNDGRVGYAYADGTSVKQVQILRFTNLVVPKKSVYVAGQKTSTNVAATKIAFAAGHPILTVSARILKVDAYGNEVALSHFFDAVKKEDIKDNEYKFPATTDQAGTDLLSFSSLSKKPGAYVYEVEVVADPGKNADAATQAACVLTARYPFIIKDDNSRILTLHYNDYTGRTQQILVNKDSKISLPAFRRTGNTFAGWASTETATTAEKKAGELLTLSKDLNLYAVWKAGEDTTTESMIMPGYAASNKSPSTYQKAVTYADVEEIVEDYYNTISKNKTKTVYWNAAKRGVGVMLTAPFQSTVTTSGCDAARKDTYMEINKEDNHAARLDKHGRDETAIKDGKKVYGCSSNLFERDAQCEGFANYMAYVVFRVKDKSAFTLCQGGGANSLKNKANDEIKPGSVVRTAGGHSYFIYKVNETYAYYIECNTDPAQDCKIQYDQKIKIDKLKTNIIKGDKIYISPAVKVEGDYTISFNANKPTDTAKITGTMQPQNAKMGVAVTLPANAFAVEGYLFGGWNTKADGSGTVYADNQSVTNLTTTSGSTVTLYAQWKAADKTYTIQYNGNGGRGTMPITNLAVGVAGNLSRNAYRKEAHVFTGWNTAADGTGTAYADQQSVLNVTTEDKKVVTLYAQWREMTEAEYLKTCTKYASHMKLTVTNASGSIMAKPVNQGTVARNLVAGETLASTALYKNASGEYWYQVQADRDGKTGFVYAGNVRNDGIANKTVRFNVSLEKTNILMGKKCDIKGSVSAQHNILHELTGKLNDSDPNTAEQTATTKSGFSSLIGTAINNNLAFGKLNRGEGTLELTAKLRSAYSSGKDLKWEEYTSPKYTLKFTVLGTNPVTYDKNTTDEVENMPAQQQKTDKTDLTLAKEIPVRAGYTFQGWATSADAQEVAYAPGALYQKDEALTLYALWAKNDEVVTYTVYYSSNKPSYGLPDAQTKTQGVPLTLNDMVPGSQFYTFTGWETEVNGERLVFQPGDTFNLDSNVTLTATWKVTSYLHDAVSGKSWELGEAFRELTETVDTTDMYHVTIGFSLSDKILAEFSSAEAWYQLHTPNVLGSWDFATLELRDGKLDFYVTPGTWITLLGDVNCAYTFEQSEDIVLNVQMLTFHGNGGLMDENDPLTDMCYSQYAVGYPQSGSPAPEFYRSGYTLLGWSNDPAAAQPLYALDMTWSQLDPGHADLYAIWQQNEVTE